MNPEAPEPIYVCPTCHSSLSAVDGGFSCGSCGRPYPVEDGIADFVSGDYYDRFAPGEALSETLRAGLDQEVAGARSRILDYYLPKIEEARRRRGDAGREWRVLDCGCGNGISVDLLNEAGVAAWGNDPSALRKWQWRERRSKDRLFVADGSSLPIPHGFFDVVLACGVLEHVGVLESRTDRYRVRPRPSRDVERIRFLGELLRVTAADGTIWLDSPNGAFPIDFWHGEGPGSARFHGPREGFLPKAGELRGYLRTLPFRTAVRFHSPHRRLQLHQVRRHWYGRAFQLPVRWLLQAMNLPLLEFLAATPLNPFLVVEIEKQRTG